MGEKADPISVINESQSCDFCLQRADRGPHVTGVQTQKTQGQPPAELMG